MFTVEAVTINDAADTTHGPALIGEEMMGLMSRWSSYKGVTGRHVSCPQRDSVIGFICETRKERKNRESIMYQSINDNI